jgi:hypothetical protein
VESATLFCLFNFGLLVGVTSYCVYAAFGPSAKSLRDPFEEHED